MTLGSSWGFDYEPFEGKSVGDPELDSICNCEVDYDTVILHIMPEYYPEWIKREQGKKILGYTVWETDKAPLHWPPLLNMVDGLMVPSRWNKTVFEQSGVTSPIWVIPHICETPPQPINLRQRWGIPAQDYVFYTINVWTERKANLKLIEAYLKAFNSNDNVTLLIKTGIRDDSKSKPGWFWRYFQSLLWDNVYMSVFPIYRKFRSPARIKLVPRFLKDRDIQFIHQRGDCYVSLCRSEGWGIGAFDAAALGKPVIITGYGGQLDFLPSNLAYLVDFTLVPVQSTLSSYTSDQHWAEPNVEHGAKLFRQVYENRDEASHKGAMLKTFIHEKFQSSVVAEQLMDVLRGVR